MQLKGMVLAGLPSLAAAAGAEDGRSWSLSAWYGVDAGQIVLGQTYQPVQQGFAVQRRLDATARVLGQEEYRILDLPLVNDVAADTNGHVHRLTFGWLQQAAPWRLRIAAALAVSSNALKHWDLLSAADLQRRRARARSG